MNGEWPSILQWLQTKSSLGWGDESSSINCVGVTRVKYLQTEKLVEVSKFTKKLTRMTYFLVNTDISIPLGSVHKNLLGGLGGGADEQF